MPLYDFTCSGCGARREDEFFHMSEDKKLPPCPCGGEFKQVINRTFQAHGVEFGSGMAINEKGVMAPYHGDHFEGSLGVYLRDKNDLKRELKKQGAVQRGDREI